MSRLKSSNGESLSYLCNTTKDLSRAELGRLELPNMGFESCGLVNGTSSEFGMIAGAISRTSSCPPKVVVAAVAEPKGKVSVLVGKESSKKRKANKVQNTQVGVFHYQDLCKSFYNGDCKTIDVGDARRLLFSIIYVCKPIVFLCFRFY